MSVQPCCCRFCIRVLNWLWLLWPATITSVMKSVADAVSDIASIMSSVRAALGILCVMFLFIVGDIYVCCLFVFSSHVIPARICAAAWDLWLR